MTIRFCKKCKTLLSPKKKDGEVFLKCSKCGFESKVDLTSSEKIKEEEEIGEGVADKGNIFATYNSKCKKCGHVGAEINDLGVQYSDEDNLFLVTCGKCGHSERIGDDS
ncbi:MAG: hypothetical protein ABIH28_01320 [archaeon]